MLLWLQTLFWGCPVDTLRIHKFRNELKVSDGKFDILFFCD